MLRLRLRLHQLLNNNETLCQGSQVLMIMKHYAQVPNGVREQRISAGGEDSRVGRRRQEAV